MILPGGRIISRCKILPRTGGNGGRKEAVGSPDLSGSLARSHPRGSRQRQWQQRQQRQQRRRQQQPYELLHARSDDKLIRIVFL